MREYLKVASFLLSVLVGVAGDPCSDAGEMITEADVVHSSPGYKADGTGTYTSGLICQWMIAAPVGNVSLEHLIFVVLKDDCV